MQPREGSPKREMGRGPIAEMLSRIPGDPRDPSVRKLRYAAKAEAILAALEGEPLEWDGVAVQRVARRELNGVPVLEVFVTADGLPAEANPFIFVNPPVDVDDGSENPAEAFRAFVSQAVAGARMRAR